VDDSSLLQEQLEVYARELQSLYREEKRQREALAEEKLVLEYRVRELTALNILFQRHLERRQQLEDILTELAAGLRRLLHQPAENLRQELEGLVSKVEAALATTPPEGGAGPPSPASSGGGPVAGY